MSIYLRRMSSFYGQAELPCPFLLCEIIWCINKAQSPLDHKSSPSAQWGQNRGRMRMVQREDACHLTKNLACFPGGSDIKSLPSMRESRVRSLSRGIGNSLQYSCLENPMDRGSWQATVHGVAESDMIEWLTLSQLKRKWTKILTFRTTGNGQGKRKRIL